MYVDKFYKVLNVNNDALIVMCVVLEGLLTDYMAIMSKGGLAAIGRVGLLTDYIAIWLKKA